MRSRIRVGIRIEVWVNWVRLGDIAFLRDGVAGGGWSQAAATPESNSGAVMVRKRDLCVKAGNLGVA